MDVARLRGLAESVLTDYSSFNILARLTQLESAFTASVQSPSAETATAYDAARTAFLDAARGAATMTLPPSKRAMLEELYAAELCGSGLVDRVDHILSVGVSPATVVAGLQNLRERMTRFQSTLEALRTTLDALRVKPEKTRMDLERQQAPQPIRDQLDAWHRDQVDAGLKTLRDEVLATIRNEARRTELTGSTILVPLSRRQDRAVQIAGLRPIDGAPDVPVLAMAQ